MNLNQILHDAELESQKKISSKKSKNGFDELGIAPSLMKAVNRLNFKSPTPIQKDAIPLAIEGKDIIGIAQTGSGKTLAFGIPMLQRLSQSKRGTGLVIVPTRELAIQVEESLQSVCHAVKIRSAVLIGGASMSVQRNVLNKNPRVIIATPGRLMDHIERKTVNLADVEVFILDEADRMLDMGFIPDIKKVIKIIPENRQTMLFSATMPKPIEAIAETLMEDPTRIDVDRSGASPVEISHEMFMIGKQEKSRLLAVQLKKSSGPVLVFTKTKWMAKKLTAKVNKMGFSTAQIHSNRTQEQRRAALEGFKRGRYKVLIATDIAARGIDVTGIELVINYDMPANSEDYVHRIGRTGRAGKTGHAISYATSDQKDTIKSIERFMKTEMKISALPTLPSEKLLLSEADQLIRKIEPSKEDRPSRRTPLRNHSPRRQDFRKSGPETFSPKRTESKPKKSQKEDSNRPESNRKAPKPQDSRKTESTKKESKPESSFWTNFKKHRPKKKSVGQGSRRKRRAKQ